jgi:hypothetical protein
VVLAGGRAGHGGSILVFTGWREAVDSADVGGQWAAVMELGDNTFWVRWDQNEGGRGDGEVRVRSLPCFIGRGGGGREGIRWSVVMEIYFDRFIGFGEKR